MATLSLDSNTDNISTLESGYKFQLNIPAPLYDPTADNLAVWQPIPTWEPAHWTEPLTPDNFITRGDDIIDFARTFMTLTRGFRQGQRFEFTNWQKWLVRAAFEEKPDGTLRYRRCLIGLPRKNGKSLLGSAIALHALLTSPAGGQIYSAARNREQAGIVFNEAREQVLRNPYLRKHIAVFRNYLMNKHTRTIYKAIAADAMSAQGLAPSLVIADEIHAWRSGTGTTSSRADEFWAALNQGSADRPEFMVIAITTAGANMDSLLGTLYRHGEAVNSGMNNDDSFGFFWWEAPEGADPYDPNVWRCSNPNLAEGLISEQDFISAIAIAESTNFGEFQRYKLNQWVRVSGESFINPLVWENNGVDGDIPEGAKVSVGFDGSQTGDSTGIVIMDVDTGNFKTFRLWEKGKQEDFYVDKDEVGSAVDEVFRKYDVQFLFADPSYFAVHLNEWSGQHRGKVIRVPQSAQRMGKIAQSFTQDIVDGTIKHLKDSDLTRHVNNAVLREDGGFSKESRGSKNKIDLLVCAALANAGRRRYFKEKEVESMNNKKVRLL